MGKLILRFDVDGVKDLEEGVPSLLELLGDLKVQGVFFVNMGRLVSRWEFLVRSPARSWRNLRPPDSVKLGLISKFGLKGAIRTFFLNPLVGAGHVAELTSVKRGGHELGLHGGMNHAVWQRRGTRMPLRAISRLADPALQIFQAGFGPPAGFASPGFCTSAAVREWLRHNGFLYSMDSWGQARKPSLRDDPVEFPVTITGPEGVPFLEHHSARGATARTVVGLFREALGSADYACLYGHPMYEGLSGKAALRAVIVEAQSAGFDVVTPSQLLNQVRSS